MIFDHSIVIVVCSLGIMIGFLRAYTRNLYTINKRNSRDIYEIRCNLKRLLKKMGEEYIIVAHKDPPPPGQPIPD